MKSALLHLVLHDLKRRWHSSLREVILYALLAAMYFSWMLYKPYYEKITSEYYLDRYGSWYAYADIPDELEALYLHVLENPYTGISNEMRQTVLTEEDILHTAYLYEQGTWNGYSIGHADEELYELCSLKILSGKIPNETEVLISQSVQNATNLSIGDTVMLELCGKPTELTVCGTVSPSQPLFPDLYTGIKSGHRKIFTDRSFGQNAGDGRIAISQWGLYLDLKQNPYGYDHYTKNNDYWRWMNEQASFHDHTLKTVLTAALVILAVFVIHSASMQKRAHELSLLKGIGMSDGQIVAMVLLRTIILNVFAMLCGTLLTFAVCLGLDHFFTMLWQFPVSGVQNALLHHPEQIASLSALITLFILAGSFLPVLKAAQNSLSGDFTACKRPRHHRHNLRFLTPLRLSLRQMCREKSIWIPTIIALALLHVFTLSNNNQKDFHTNISETGAVDVNFQSMHFLSLWSDAPLDVSLYAQPNQSYAQMQVKNIPVPLQLQFPSTTLYCRNTNAVCIDDEVSKRIRIEGRMPQKPDEILVYWDSTYLYKIEDNMEFTVERPLRIGDTLLLDDKAFVITGQVIPNETIEVDSAGMISPLFDPVNTTFAFCEEAFSALNSPVRYGLNLYTEHTDELLPMLNGFFAAGLMNGITFGMSDHPILWWNYSPRFEGISLQISYGTAALPTMFALLLILLIQIHKIAAEKHVYQILYAIGMTEQDILLYSFLKAGICTACLGLILISTIQMVSPVSAFIRFVIAFLYFFLLSAIPLTFTKARKYKPGLE